MTVESLGTSKIPRSHPQSWLGLELLEAWWLVVCWVESVFFLIIFSAEIQGRSHDTLAERGVSAVR